MSTTWPTRKASEVLSGDGAKVLGQNLFDRDQCIKGKGTTFYFAETSHATSTLTTKTSVQIVQPNYARGSEFIRVTAWVRSTSGASTASFRVTDNATGTVGTTATTTSTTYVLLTSTITIASDTWSGTIRTINVQLAASSATTYAKGEDIVANLRFGD